MAALAKGIFHQYRHQGLNYLSLHDPSTPKDDYFYQEWQMPMKQRRLMKRFQSRAFGPGSTPYILNSEELATIFHFPTAEARTPVLTTLPTRLAEPPVELEFAREGEPELPNLERTQTDVVGVAAPVLPESPTRLVVPKPVAPTEQAMMEPAAVPLEPGMPRPGMPAPLPPGLDLAEEPLEENPGSPRNLPL